MPHGGDSSSAILDEFARLKLNLKDSPYRVISSEPGGAERFLAHLQAMEPGITWRDVYPDMPAHWIPGRPETWTHKYKPFGAFDYAEPPAGPAFYVHWSERGAGSLHEALVKRATDEGWPVYGGGIAPDRRPNKIDDLGFLVLRRGTPEDVLDRILEWILAQPGIKHSRLYRTEDEQWAP